MALQLHRIICLALAAGALTLSGCHSQSSQAPAQAANMGPPQVTYAVVQAAPLPVVTDLAGRMEATRVAQVRARVAGVVQRVVVRGGTDVAANTVLFQIDPAPFQAALHSAEAILGKATAAQTQAHSKEARFRNLVRYRAVSQQDYTDALGAAQQADADVAAGRAAVETARLNLGYATVTAPIAGRVGIPQVTEGALVGQGEATLLATIQQLDPIYMDLTQSSSDVLKIEQAVNAGKLKTVNPGEARMTLLLDNNTVYPMPGRLLFSDLTVDPGTGMITLRAEFPNPGHLLLPGMYARARFEQAVNTSALTVPQQSLSRGPNGAATVMVIGPGNRVANRPVVAGEARGTTWVITSGLKPGDRVVVEGLQKVKPGSPVTPIPYANPASPPAPAGR